MSCVLLYESNAGGGPGGRDPSQSSFFSFFFPHFPTRMEARPGGGGPRGPPPFPGYYMPLCPLRLSLPRGRDRRNPESTESSVPRMFRAGTAADDGTAAEPRIWRSIPSTRPPRKSSSGVGVPMNGPPQKHARLHDADKPLAPLGTCGLLRTAAVERLLRPARPPLLFRDRCARVLASRMLATSERTAAVFSQPEIAPALL